MPRRCRTAGVADNDERVSAKKFETRFHHARFRAGSGIDLAICGGKPDRRSAAILSVKFDDVLLLRHRCGGLRTNPPLTVMPRPTPSASTLYRHALQARRVRCGTLQTRAASSQVKPIELHFDKVVPPDGNETQNPLVILHGLLCAQNHIRES